MEPAYHEAGHAVVRFWDGKHTGTAFSFKSVSIVKDEDSLGRVIHRLAGDWFQPDLEITCRVRKRLEHEIRFSLAGVLAAEKAGFGGVGGEPDFAYAANLALYMNGSARATEAYLNWLQVQTIDVLNQERVWRAVESLAASLVQSEIIRWQEARQIITDALMPGVNVTAP